MLLNKGKIVLRAGNIFPCLQSIQQKNGNLGFHFESYAGEHGEAFDCAFPGVYSVHLQAEKEKIKKTEAVVQILSEST